MPFHLKFKGSKKLLPKIQAPMRRARLSQDGTLNDRKPETPLKTISINLDGVVSTLIKDGNWCVDHEKVESRQCLYQIQINEKLTRENEILKKRNEILMDLAKTITDEIDTMEKELRKLRRIVKKCAPKCLNKG